MPDVSKRYIEEIVDAFILHDEDEQARAFVRFCSLLSECVLDSEAQQMVIVARDRAYSRTLHFNNSLDAFEEPALARSGNQVIS
jgi:hypothetical protein